MKKSRIEVHTLLFLFLSSMWGCVPLENAPGLDDPHATVSADQLQAETPDDYAVFDVGDPALPDMEADEEFTAGKKFTPPEPAETLAEEVQGFGQLGQLDGDAQDMLTPSGFPLAKTGM